MKATKNAKALEEFGSAEAKAFNDVQEPPKIPDDLGVKIGSKYEVFLTRVKDMMVDELENARMTQQLNELFIPVLEKEIKKESRKFK